MARTLTGDRLGETGGTDPGTGGGMSFDVFQKAGKQTAFEDAAYLIQDEMLSDAERICELMHSRK